MKQTGSPIFCNLTSLSEDQRSQLMSISAELLGQADRVVELPDGYSVGYRRAPEELMAKMATFIALDRLCCAFLEHGIVSEADGGATWLTFRGGPGAKEVIASDLLGLVPRRAAAAESSSEKP
jgi:hypothetical protein